MTLSVVGHPQPSICCHDFMFTFDHAVMKRKTAIHIAVSLVGAVVMTAVVILFVFTVFDGAEGKNLVVVLRYSPPTLV